MRGKKGGIKAYIFNERINGQLVATPAYDWFNKALEDAEVSGSDVASV